MVQCQKSKAEPQPLNQPLCASGSMSAKWGQYHPLSKEDLKSLFMKAAARSSPQPLDLCLLSPMTSAYSAMRSVPDSHLINDYQPLDHRLISFTISAYSAMRSVPESHLINDYQPLDQHLSSP